MSFETLKFRAKWFKDQEDKLEKAAEELDCVGEKLAAIDYTWEDGNRFSKFKPAYAALVTATTSGPGGTEKGVELLDALRETMLSTGRAYLRTEAANEGLVQEIDNLIAELDL